MSIQTNMLPAVRNVPIAKPIIGELEKQAVLAVLESGELAQGKWVAKFEEAFAAYHHARYGVATSSGTSALMATLLAHEIGAGDEVIVPSFSFFATASCLLSVGARPIFADIDPKTYTLDPDAAEAAITPRTKAIMPVHMFGYPADMPRIQRICEQHGLILLEDAAQAHGARLGDQFVGSWGTASFSFYPTKNMTTTEGGMVLTNDAQIAQRLRLARNHGMNQQYLHETLGYNFRMTNLAAAIGGVQLQQLPGWTEQRIQNAQFYYEHLEGVRLPHVEADVTHTYHQFTVRAPEGTDRDQIVRTLNQRGIGARIYYPRPIHQQPIFQKMGGYEQVTLPETETATREVFSLPVHPSLTLDDLRYVASEVNALC